VPRKALIIGLGLIGGSAGMALRKKGWQVLYADPNVEPDAAITSGAADARSDNSRNADVIVVATPVDLALTQVREMGPQSAVVTSVCSVMAPLRHAATGRFVAGHPLAGSEQRGLAAARPDLFEGATWFLDAHDDLVEALVADCGARADFVNAEEHDRAVAATSHLPQILSTALAAYLDANPELARYAGGGLHTFLRLAGSDASVWQPILDANHTNVSEHAEQVLAIIREIVDGDAAQAFEKAQRFMKR
jgi:prephenate dehydrogenase